jgi:hypothetical protein
LQLALSLGTTQLGSRLCGHQLRLWFALLLLERLALDTLGWLLRLCTHLLLLLLLLLWFDSLSTFKASPQAILLVCPCRLLWLWRL